MKGCLLTMQTFTEEINCFECLQYLLGKYIPLNKKVNTVYEKSFESPFEIFCGSRCSGQILIPSLLVQHCKNLCRNFQDYCHHKPQTRIHYSMLSNVREIRYYYADVQITTLLVIV